MGAFLDKPKTEKQTKSGSGKGLSYGLSSMQGWRVEMEDAHCSIIGLPFGLDEWSFFAVFDGHAGAKVSAYCADQLPEAIIANEDFRAGGSADSGSSVPLENVHKAMKTGFLNLDVKMREMPEMMSGEDKSGSTAVVAMLSPQHIFFANCGDSRGVLSRGGKVQFSTLDHKPVNPQEKERILNAGGSVMIQRVNGSLAVSRALGDFEYKNVEGKGPCEQLVSPEPETSVESRSLEDDEFILLACDGIWDVMTNEDVCDFVRSRMQLTADLESICNQVVDTCLFKGSKDNMSIVIIAFPGAPKVSKEAAEKEAELDKRLEVKVKEILESSDAVDGALPYIMHVLSQDEIPGLPPGGGLSAKRSTIEQILTRLRPSSDEHNATDGDAASL